MNMVPASKTASSIFHRQVDAQGFILAETAAISTRTVAPDWEAFHNECSVPASNRGLRIG